MGKKVSLTKQGIDELDKMAAYGNSKQADKRSNGGKPLPGKIYSYNTMKNYKQVVFQYCKWAQREHGCHHLADARQYTGEYLQQRMAAGKSAWTVRLDAAALAKLYGVETTALGTTLPTRHRADVTQHRTGASEGHFSADRNRDLVDLCRATGLRRCEVARLQPADVQRLPDGRVVILVEQGKGGKARIVSALNDRPAQIAEAAAAAGKAKLFETIPKYAPIHEYRAVYANELYGMIARPTNSIPDKDRYCCRRDKAGTVYDKQAMLRVSLELGHNRLDVVTAYLK